MDRRSFFASLPFAASAPALAAGARTGGVEGWQEVQVSPNLDLGRFSARLIRVVGAGEIDNFGEAPPGLQKELVFTGPAVLKHDEEMQLPNNGADLRVAAGDAMSCVSLGRGAWKVTHYQPATVFTKVDRAASRGAAPYRLAIGNDAATTAPDFAVDGGAARTKTWIKSIFLNDPGDTPEIALICADGSASHMSARHAGYPGSFIYGWPVDTTGSLFADVSDKVDTDFILIGRSQQIAFPLAETPTPRGRGGHLVFSVTPVGKRTPIDRQVISQNGRVAFFGNAFESWLQAGNPYPYPTRHLAVGAGGHPVPRLNWLEYSPPGVVSIIASDAAMNSALSVRRWNDPETGFDLDYDFGRGELRLNTVRGGAKTPRWRWSGEGHLTPAAMGSSDLGSPERPVRAVHAGQLRAERDGDGPAAVFRSGRQGFSGDVVELRADAHPGGDFSFIRAVAGPGQGEVKLRLSGDGHGAIDGAWTSAGSGYGEYFEWADGNPQREDRVGLSVVLEGGKIRPASPSDPPHAVIGVVTVRAVAIGNAAWSHWQGKYLTDDFGRPVTRPVVYLRWREILREPQAVERVRTVKEAVLRTRRRPVEAEAPGPGLQRRGDLWIQTGPGEARTFDRSLTERVAVHSAEGGPLRDAAGRPLTAEAPVYEEAEIERSESWFETEQVETGCQVHCCPADAVPASLSPPADAERIVVQERVLNPDYLGGAYAPRPDRPEWAAVSLIGQERLRRGQPVGERWIRLGAVSEAVETWLLR